MGDCACGRIVAVLRGDGITLDLETKHHERREGVAELQDATRTNNDDPAVDLWDR